MSNPDINTRMTDDLTKADEVISTCGDTDGNVFLKQIYELSGITDPRDVNFEEIQKKAFTSQQKLFDFFTQISFAAKIYPKGHICYPSCDDLLEDDIRYYSDSRETKRPSEYLQALHDNVPVQYWHKSTFESALDFYAKDDPFGKEEEYRNIITYYKKSFPLEEDTYLAESELEILLGNKGASEAILKEAVEVLQNANRCARRLAELQIKNSNNPILGVMKFSHFWTRNRVKKKLMRYNSKMKR